MTNSGMRAKQGDSLLPSLSDDALRVVKNSYGSMPRHTRARDGGCRGDCVPCGVARLARHFPDDDIACRVAQRLTERS